jgi:hypothetical protein
MNKVIYTARMSLDGFITMPNDEVGPLFDWYFNGDTDYPPRVSVWLGLQASMI